MNDEYIDADVFDIDDFEKVLLLKNQLILLTKEDLRILYSDIRCFLAFIDNVNCLLQKEGAFLYLSRDFLDKIQDVLAIHRFDLNEKELQSIGTDINDVYEAINRIMVCLNNISSDSKSYRKIVVKSYLTYNENVRNTKFKKIEDFGTALTYDAPVYFTLTEEFEEPIRDDFMLSSIYYFMEVAPEIFKNEKTLKKAEQIIDEIHKKSNMFDISGKILTKKAKLKLKSLY